MSNEWTRGFSRLSLLGTLYSLLLLEPAQASTSNLYVTPNGTATGNCPAGTLSAPNLTPVQFNSGSNWGNGPGQIGPGTMVLVCGIFTGAAGATEFTFQGSGTFGNPITLQFDTGTQLNAPYWGSYQSAGAIQASGRSYIVIDGGTNGLIQNTANGTNLTYHAGTTIVYLNNCTPGCEVENLTMKNIYVKSGTTDGNGNSSAGVYAGGNSTGLHIHNNTITSVAKAGVMVNFGHATANNVEIDHNTISDICWGINLAAGDSASDTSTGALIHDNTISNWSNWALPSSCHTDGVIIFNCYVNSSGCGYSGLSSQAPTLTATLWNNYFHGDLGDGLAGASPTSHIYCAQNASCVVFNNLFVNEGHDTYGLLTFDTNQCGQKAYNNTFIGNGSSNDVGINLGTSPCVTGSLNGKVTVENNVIVNQGVGIHDYCTLINDVGTSNDNVFRNQSGSASSMYTNDGTPMSYATWQSHGFDANSTTNDPKLSASYLPQTGSSAIGAGANLTSLGLSPLDIDRAGVARPASGAWDIGAYQYSSSVGSYSACDINKDGVTNVADVQMEINMALGKASCTNQSGTCNVTSVQKVINAALGGTCVAP